MTVQSRRLASVAALALLAGIAVIALATEPAAASGPLRTHAVSKGKFIGLAWDAQMRLWSMTALEYPVDGNEQQAASDALYAGMDLIANY